MPPDPPATATAVAPPQIIKEGTLEQQQALGLEPGPKDPQGIDLSDLGALKDLLGQDDTKTKPVDPTESAGTQTYFSIWGVKPPHGYIKALVQQGYNAFEIAQHELQKPGAQNTQYWRDHLAQYASIAAEVFGRR